jgi:hypothetical protein
MHHTPCNRSPSMLHVAVGLLLSWGTGMAKAHEITLLLQVKWGLGVIALQLYYTNLGYIPLLTYYSSPGV